MLLSNFNDKDYYYKPNLTQIDINFIDTDLTNEQIYSMKPLIKEFRWIIEKNYIELSKYATAPINVLNLFKQTPLMLAAKLNDERAMQILRHKDVGRCDKNGRIAKDLITNNKLKYILEYYE
jgi:hypothetical protein